MTKFNQKSKPHNLSQNQSKSVGCAAHDEQDDTLVGLRIHAAHLIKRVNALITHVSDIDGGVEAEKNARETSGHLKNIKDVIELNERINKLTQEEESYTPEEEEAMAAELAALIFKHGGFK